MKLLLAVFVTLSSGMVWAMGDDQRRDEGDARTGLTSPNDYYNADLKCSIMDGVAMYINLAPALKLSVSAYHAKANKVFSRYLHLTYDHQIGDSHFYRIESTHECGHVAYLEMGYGARIWDGQGNVISTCEKMTYPGHRAPAYP